MTTIVFGDTLYDISTENGIYAFLKKVNEHSKTIPEGTNDLMFMSIMGAGKAEKKKKRSKA